MGECLRLLMERLPSGHSQQAYLEKELHRYEAGVRGEQRLHDKMVEFHWHEPFELMWDTGLRLGDWKVQIDGLLVTPRCIIIIDSKNISGKIHFDAATHECYRFNNEGEKWVFDDPRVQLAKIVRFLELWLEKRKIPYPPIFGVAVFTPKHCEFISKPAGLNICKTYQVVETVYRILESQKTSADSPKPIRIRRIIESNSHPYERPPLCKYYRIDPHELKSGVKCVECREIAVERLYKTWRCLKCGKQDANALKNTLREYLELVSQEVDSKVFRRFSGEESRHTVFRVLSEANLVKVGSTRKRTYIKKK